MDASLTTGTAFDSILFAHLIRVVSSVEFRQGTGLNNEIPFYICSYAAEQANEANKNIPALVAQLIRRDVSVFVVDLYEVALELLKTRGLLTRLIDREPSLTKSDLGATLRNVLDPEKHFVPTLRLLLDGKQYDVLFITGVGEVFPYIRTHSLLNNMQSHFKEKPVVLFFPGTYHHNASTGTALDLFNQLHEDHYYRAFDIRALHPKTQ